MKKILVVFCFALGITFFSLSNTEYAQAKSTWYKFSCTNVSGNSKKVQIKNNKLIVKGKIYKGKKYKKGKKLKSKKRVFKLSSKCKIYYCGWHGVDQYFQMSKTTKRLFISNCLSMPTDVRFLVKNKRVKLIEHGAFLYSAKDEVLWIK